MPAVDSKQIRYERRRLAAALRRESAQVRRIPPVKPRKSSFFALFRAKEHGKFYLAYLGVLILMLLFLTPFLVVENTPLEQKLFDEARQRNHLKGWEEFLVACPRDTDLSRRLRREAARQLRFLREKELFNLAMQEREPSIWRQYLNWFPEGARSDVALKKLAELGQDYAAETAGVGETTPSPLTERTYSEISLADADSKISQKFQQARQENTIAGWRKFLREYPRSSLSALAENEIGVLLFLERRYEEAFDHYETALEELSDHPLVLTNAGFCLYFLNDYEQAFALFTRALAIDSDYGSARLGLRWTEVRRLQEKSKPSSP